MKLFVKTNLFRLALAVLSTNLFVSVGHSELIDCKTPATEMAGFHNMVLFGDPEDQLYIYHLPLFAGSVNGHHGHVLMHVYQGIWNVSFDEGTLLAYAEKFKSEQSSTNLFPFFTISPKGKSFKVPDMVCDQGFKTDTLAVYGHVEGNPKFPKPELITSELSKLTVKKTVFTNKFDGSSKEELTFILFGTQKQLYLGHFLTDDENSFDQIVAISKNDQLFAKIQESQGSMLVSIPQELNMNLATSENGSEKANNKFVLPTQPLGQKISVTAGDEVFEVSIKGQVYYNDNSDLKIK